MQSEGRAPSGRSDQADQADQGRQVPRTALRAAASLVGWAAATIVFAAALFVTTITAFDAAAQTPDRGDAAQSTPSGDLGALEQARRDGATILVIPQDRGAVWDYGVLGGGDRDVDGYARLAEGYATDDTMLDRTQSGVSAFRDKLLAKLDAAPLALGEIQRTLSEASPSNDARHFALVGFVVGLGLFLGYLIEMWVYARLIVGPWFAAQQIPNPQGYVDKLPILALRVALTIGGVLLSSLVAVVFASAFYTAHEATLKTAIVIVGTYCAMRLVEAIWRMILSPYLPDYRIPSMSNADARRLFNWLSIVAAFAIGSLAFCLWVENLGVDPDIHALITSALTLITVVMNIAMIRVNHRAITQAILGKVEIGRSSVLAQLAARIWAPLAGLYFAVAWAEMTYRLILDLPLGVPLIAGAYFILMVVLVVYAGVSYLIEWSFRRQRAIRALNAGANLAPVVEASDRADGDLPDDDGDEAGGPAHAAPTVVYRPVGYRMRTMEDLARRVASILAVLAGAWSLLWIWGADQNWMGGETLLASVSDVAFVAFFGYLAYHSVRIAIDQKIEAEGGTEVSVEPGDEGGGAAAASRLATLLPLFRNFLLVTIAIVTTLMALLETGVNVTPIFAGAGVIGLAIGFGAQTLVRDIFSGIFFLVDDAFRKGEYIDIGSVKGTVEKISIRSFQLRHHLGYLHTVPFGEIQYLTNYSRDWVMMKLPLRLTYDTDVREGAQADQEARPGTDAGPDHWAQILAAAKEPRRL